MILGGGLLAAPRGLAPPPLSEKVAESEGAG